MLLLFVPVLMKLPIPGLQTWVEQKESLMAELPLLPWPLSFTVIICTPSIQAVMVVVVPPSVLTAVAFKVNCLVAPMLGHSCLQVILNHLVRRAIFD